ncbi:MAG: NTP pyrophosphatase (non-canonical NTP hydrolase) [Candidatus Nanohaloarchaea archaeon]|jgi:NTP pyrophosphatase (non-canonical NTP hydrolase)
MCYCSITKVVIMDEKDDKSTLGAIAGYQIGNMLSVAPGPLTGVKILVDHLAKDRSTDYTGTDIPVDENDTTSFQNQKNTSAKGGDNEMTEVGPDRGDIRELSGKARHDYATKQLLEQDLAETEAEAEEYAEVLVELADATSSYEEDLEQMGEDFQQVVDDMVTYLDGNQDQLENMRDKVEGIERTLEGAVRTAYEVEGVDVDTEDFEYDLGPIGRQHLNSLHNFVESVYGEDN